MHFRDTRIKNPKTVEKLYNPLWANLQVNILQNLANELTFKNIVGIYER